MEGQTHLCFPESMELITSSMPLLSPVTSFIKLG